METTFNYKEINFRFRRTGWFGALLLAFIALLIGFVCAIECYLVPQNDGLTPELGLIVPIFYGILSLATATCWSFIVLNNILMMRKYADDIKTHKHLIWISWCCFFVPLIFGFLGSKIAYNYHTYGRATKHEHIKVEKDKKNQNETNENPANTPYEYNGAWYYYDENKNYYTVSNDTWVSCENPHTK